MRMQWGSKREESEKQGPSSSQPSVVEKASSIGKGLSHLQWSWLRLEDMRADPLGFFTWCCVVPEEPVEVSFMLRPPFWHFNNQDHFNTQRPFKIYIVLLVKAVCIWLVQVPENSHQSPDPAGDPWQAALTLRTPHLP